MLLDYRIADAIERTFPESKQRLAGAALAVVNGRHGEPIDALIATLQAGKEALDHLYAVSKPSAAPSAKPRPKAKALTKAPAPQRSKKKPSPQGRTVSRERKSSR